jgi:DNA polymerase III delta prime subunit
MSNIPFVEKYRPTDMNDIILNDVNKIIINSIIDKQIYPNLLLYGPPGTGKTTTIINLVNNIQVNKKNKSLLLHLNASDERGIDTIRNQITKFISSKPMFSNGVKFIVLDEVDYMTKSAQQALKYVLQQYTSKAVFCLMCNYISKIEPSLKSEFIELKFNALPKENILSFLQKICRNENIIIENSKIEQIQELYNSDIRSMINYIQLNYQYGYNNSSMLYTKSDLIELYDRMGLLNKEDRKEKLVEYCVRCNITPKYLLMSLLLILIQNERITDKKIIDKYELIIHEDQYNIYDIDYFLELLYSVC